MKISYVEFLRCIPYRPHENLIFKISSLLARSTSIMTTEKSIVSAVIAEEEEAVDNITATIIKFENKRLLLTSFF